MSEDGCLDSLLSLMTPSEDVGRREKTLDRRSLAADSSAYYSCVDENSWLAGRDSSADSTDCGEDGDRTLQSPQTDAAKSASSDIDIQHELDEIERRRELLLSQLQTRKPPPLPAVEDVGPAVARLRLVPLEFEAAAASNDSTVGSRKNVLADDADDSDEASADANSQLSETGRSIRDRIKESESESADRAIVANTTTALRSQAVIAGKRVQQSASGDAPLNAVAGAAVFDAYFGLRIRTPKLSSEAFGQACSDLRKMRLGSLRPNAPPTDDWLTMAVVVEKGPPKKTVKGSRFAVWSLSDLSSDAAAPAKLWLFGDAFDKHWKIGVGTAVALKNAAWSDAAPPAAATDTRAAPPKASALRLKLASARQLVEVGACVDFGLCSGRRRGDGAPCRAFVNRSRSDFCAFHANAATKTFAARRGELQQPSNVAPKSWERRVFGTQSLGGARRGGAARPAALSLGQLRANQKLSKAAGAASGREPASRSDGANEAAPSKAVSSSSSTGDEQDAENLFVERLNADTAGSRNVLKFLKEKDDMEDPEATKKAAAASKSTFKELLTHVSAAKRALPPRAAPQLGRGWVGASNNTRDKRKFDAEAAARARAAATLRTAATRSASDAAASPPPALQRDQMRSPLKKRTRLGEMNLSEEKLQQLVKSRSAHESVLDREQVDRQNDYFSTMQVREKAETFASGLTEVADCKVVTCKRCAYTWHAQSEFCKQQGHVVQRHTATKRFFKCVDCSTRAVAYTLLPTKPCKSCGATSYERTGMRPERRGPQLPSEQLLVRGEERPFVNS